MAPFNAPSQFIPLETLEWSGVDDSHLPDVPLQAGFAALMVTRRCNMSCAHCSVESGPKAGNQPTLESLLKIVDDAAKNKIQGLLITGGEPMLRENEVIIIMNRCKELGLSLSMTSNGFWGKTPERASETLKKLVDAGLKQISISYDRYHAEFQGPEPALNIARAAKQLNLTFNIGITRTQDETDLREIVAPFDEVPSAMLRFYDVQPIGRARDFDLSTLRPQLKGFCNACFSPAITEDGRITACNGPAYFSPVHSPLVLGSLEKEQMETLLKRHQNDPILETIRTFGPVKLLEEAQKMPELSGLIRDDYRGMCDVCLHLTDNPVIVAKLRAHLSDSYSVAQRLAVRKIIEGERRGGRLTREYANNLGAAQLFFQAATQEFTPTEFEKWSKEADKILGRADFDWHHWLRLLIGSGLCAPINTIINAPVVQEYAPSFFIEGIQKRAMLESMRTLMQRDAMRQLAEVLRENNVRGVLLKGGAIAALALEDKSNRMPTRGSEDIDVWIDPKSAPLIWKKMVERGFKVPDFDKDFDPDRPSSHLHQLPQLIGEGMFFEFHQTLLPPYCGLPNQDMLNNIQPLKNPEFEGLATLDAAAMVVHSLVHGTKHFFTYNLKSAVDIRWIHDHFGEVNWERVEQLGRKTRMNRGFWVPLNLLAQGFDLGVPNSILNNAPNDKRQQQLEKFAKRFIYGATDFPFDHNPYVRWGLYMLLIDSPVSRARLVLGFLFGKESAEFRAKSQKLGPTEAGPSQDSHYHPRKLLHAYKAWKKLG
jgi:pyruvate-formate lyase-activating enzyme